MVFPPALSLHQYHTIKPPTFLNRPPHFLQHPSSASASREKPPPPLITPRRPQGYTYIYQPLSGEYYLYSNVWFSARLPRRSAFQVTDLCKCTGPWRRERALCECLMENQISLREQLLSMCVGTCVLTWRWRRWWWCVLYVCVWA